MTRIYDATSAFVTHRNVGWECEGPGEGTGSSFLQDITIVLAEERSYLARDRQPIVEYLNGDLVSRDAGDFERYCYRVRHRVLEYVHSTISNRVRGGHGEEADRNIPWLEDTVLSRGLSDMTVGSGVVMHRIVVVARRVHVVGISCHVGG